MLSHNFIERVVLGGHHPEDVTSTECLQMLEINIRLVENHNLSLLHARAQFPKTVFVLETFALLTMTKLGRKERMSSVVCIFAAAF